MRKHSTWEREIIRGALALPILIVACVAIGALYTVFGCIKILSWVDLEGRP